MGVVLLSSTGLGLIEHPVYMSNSNAALKKTDRCIHCTSKNKGEATLKGSDCESEKKLTVIDLSPVVDKVGQFLATIYFAIADAIVNFFQCLLQSSKVVLPPTNHSPPVANQASLS